MLPLKVVFCTAVLMAMSPQAAFANPPKAPVAIAFDIRLMNITFAVSDMERAAEFYSKGLGLKVGTKMNRGDVVELPLAFPSGGPGILLVSAKKTLSAKAPMSGRAILSVSDIASLKSQLEAAGYAMRGPISDVPQFHVRVGHLQDPDGNELELVQMPR